MFIKTKEIKIAQGGKRGLQVYLPKSWFSDQKLKSGDTLFVFIDADTGALAFSPKRLDRRVSA